MEPELGRVEEQQRDVDLRSTQRAGPVALPALGLATLEALERGQGELELEVRELHFGPFGPRREGRGTEGKYGGDEHGRLLRFARPSVWEAGPGAGSARTAPGLAPQGTSPGFRVGPARPAPRGGAWSETSRHDPHPWPARAVRRRPPASSPQPPPPGPRPLPTGCRRAPRRARGRGRRIRPPRRGPHRRPALGRLGAAARTALPGARRGRPGREEARRQGPAGPPRAARGDAADDPGGVPLERATRARTRGRGPGGGEDPAPRAPPAPPFLGASARPAPAGRRALVAPAPLGRARLRGTRRGAGRDRAPGDPGGDLRIVDGRDRVVGRPARPHRTGNARERGPPALADAGRVQHLRLRFARGGSARGLLRRAVRKPLDSRARGRRLRLRVGRVDLGAGRLPAVDAGPPARTGRGGRCGACGCSPGRRSPWRPPWRSSC